MLFKERRFGKICITYELLQEIVDSSSELFIFDGMIVVDCHHDIAMGLMEYTLYAPFFSALEAGEEVKDYYMEIEKCEYGLRRIIRDRASMTRLHVYKIMGDTNKELQNGDILRYAWKSFSTVED